MEELNTNAAGVEINEKGGASKKLGARGIFTVALIPARNGEGNFTRVTQRVPVRISAEAKVLTAKE